MSENRREAVSAVLAVTLGVAIVLIRLPLQPSLGSNAPFILAWPATLLAAFLGGFWPAVIVGLVGLWVGQQALTLTGGPGLRLPGMSVYMAFIFVFAMAGGLRKRGLRRQKEDAERLKQMSTRLTQVARLNAMGELAGTLAHELNQPLTAIASYAGAAEHLVRRQASGGDEVADLLRKVTEQTMRTREIIGRIRGYVSGGDLSLAEHSLREMFEEAVAIATATAGQERPVVRYAFDFAVDRVVADRIQVQQVMVNLLRNAAEAMRGQPKRELTVGSRPADGHMVEAFVMDTGAGLSPELAERLFEPFVTGKADGMGIGLSVSRSLVEAHGGRIWAEAAPDGGAVFRFTLNRAGQETRG